MKKLKAKSFIIDGKTIQLSSSADNMNYYDQGHEKEKCIKKVDPSKL